MIYSIDIMVYSVYLHIPFCKQRCSYCDFNTYAGMESLIPEYVDVLCSEIQFLSDSTDERLPVHTVYFGGGTPSLLSINQVEQIFKTLDSCFGIQPDFEATLEANPGTVSRDRLRELHSLGVNRLSLGMQSANPRELTLLERIHDHTELIQSVKWAREAGFCNLNLDLIFGLPEQSLKSWKRNLNLALDLNPEHLSLYALTLEEGTTLERWVRRGLISELNADLAADMYEWAGEKLEKSGYAQYEISNWGRKLEEVSDFSLASEGLLACRHNLQYWRNLPYLGFGAGAHGYAGKMRTANVISPIDYIQRISAFRQQSSAYSRQPAATQHRPKENNGQITRFPVTPATQEAHPIDIATEIGETMMMGLRLTREGVSQKAFYRRFRQAIKNVYGTQVERLTSMGLLEWAGKNQDILRLTSKGRFLGNRVFMEFL